VSDMRPCSVTGIRMGLTEFGNQSKLLKYSEKRLYVGHLESKERLRVQPAQLFHFS